MRILAVNLNLKNSQNKLKSLRGFASVTLLIEDKELQINDFRIYDNNGGRSWIILPQLEWTNPKREVCRKPLLRMVYSWEEEIKSRILDEYQSLTAGVGSNGN